MRMDRGSTHSKLVFLSYLNGPVLGLYFATSVVSTAGVLYLSVIFRNLETILSILSKIYFFSYANVCMSMVLFLYYILLVISFGTNFKNNLVHSVKSMLAVFPKYYALKSYILFSVLWLDKIHLWYWFHWFVYIGIVRYYTVQCVRFMKTNQYVVDADQGSVIEYVNYNIKDLYRDIYNALFNISRETKDKNNDDNKYAAICVKLPSKTIHLVYYLLFHLCIVCWLVAFLLIPTVKQLVSNPIPSKFSEGCNFIDSLRYQDTFAAGADDTTVRCSYFVEYEQIPHLLVFDVVRAIRTGASIPIPSFLSDCMSKYSSKNSPLAIFATIAPDILMVSYDVVEYLYLFAFLMFFNVFSGMTGSDCGLSVSNSSAKSVETKTVTGPTIDVSSGVLRRICVYIAFYIKHCAIYVNCFVHRPAELLVPIVVAPLKYLFTPILSLLISLSKMMWITDCTFGGQGAGFSPIGALHKIDGQSLLEDMLVESVYDIDGFSDLTNCMKKIPGSVTIMMFLLAGMVLGGSPVIYMAFAFYLFRLHLATSDMMAHIRKFNDILRLNHYLEEVFPTAEVDAATDASDPSKATLETELEVCPLCLCGSEGKLPKGNHMKLLPCGHILHLNCMRQLYHRHITTELEKLSNKDRDVLVERMERTMKERLHVSTEELNLDAVAESLEEIDRLERLESKLHTLQCLICRAFIAMKSGSLVVKDDFCRPPPNRILDSVHMDSTPSMEHLDTEPSFNPETEVDQMTEAVVAAQAEMDLVVDTVLNGSHEINSILSECNLQLPDWKLRELHANVVLIQETCQRNEFIADTESIVRDLISNNFNWKETMENMQK